MGKADGFATPSAWASWSPSQFTSHVKIQRRYVQIPSDQRGLLDRRDAWSPSGFPKVPRRVLEDVWARHVETTRSCPEAVREASSSQSPSSVHHEQEHQHSTPKEPPAEANRGSDAKEEDPEPGVELSWPPSPSWHHHKPRPPEEPTTAISSPSQHSSTKKRSRVMSTAMHRAVYLNEFPSSSNPASETGLEVEVPGVITDILEPVNRGPVSALEPTPPSAQIIPSTLADTTSPVRAPKAKRPRLMKPPGPLFQSPENVGHKQAEKLGPWKTVPARLSRSPSPMVFSSSPVAKCPVPLSAEDRRLPEADTKPDILTAPQHAVDPESSNSTDKVPPNGPPSQVPFTAFKIGYPDYDGSLGDFIRGVMCVLRVHKDRALPSFLYDDFVRVFSSDYVEYVGSIDGKEPALSAVQWYNENVSRPLYSKGILNKSNITDILSHYPDEVRAIRQKLVAAEAEIQGQDSPRRPAAIGGHERSSQQTPSMIKAPRLFENHYTPTAAVPAIPNSLARRAQLPSDPVYTTEKPRFTGGARVAANADMSGLVSARQPSVDMARSTGSALAVDDTESDLGSLQSQIDLPFPDIEQSQTPPRTRVEMGILQSARDLPSAILTQQSNPESIAEPTLKRRAKPAGEPGASYKKPTRTKQDFKKRAKEFLTQYRATQSSAPRGSSAS
ncbi:hypothetical protein MFIFM68171_00477 [Madurella fahalii]|uniref:Uncharacterized protein n=1 Tax=Madurella fahalii TaxID=1157608 RepID=A0ABQ0FXM6_9PEZI